MALDLPPIEIVSEISDEQQNQILKDHFYIAYRMFAGNQFIPDAAFENIDGMVRCLSGIPFPFMNVVFGYSNEKENWDESIDEQMNYFKAAKMPFAWYVDEEGDQEFQNKLKNRGFQHIGFFRGVIGFLDQPIPLPVIPEGYTIEAVETEAAMNDYQDLVAATFGCNDQTKELMKIACWNATKTTDPTMYHWVIRNEGKVVSALSTLISGECVSFWNGASVPELRKQGLSTALRRHALRHAISKGCKMGMSFLMSEGLAYGICSKLGYKTKWRFNVFLPPANE